MMGPTTDIKTTTFWGALAGVICMGVKMYFGVAVPPEVAAALPVVVAGAAGYLTKHAWDRPIVADRAAKKAEALALKAKTAADKAAAAKAAIPST